MASGPLDEALRVMGHANERLAANLSHSATNRKYFVLRTLGELGETQKKLAEFQNRVQRTGNEKLDPKVVLVLEKFSRRLNSATNPLSSLVVGNRPPLAVRTRDALDLLKPIMGIIVAPDYRPPGR
jgi:hypothetical protein